MGAVSFSMCVFANISSQSLNDGFILLMYHTQRLLH